VFHAPLVTSTEVEPPLELTPTPSGLTGSARVDHGEVGSWGINSLIRSTKALPRSRVDASLADLSDIEQSSFGPRLRLDQALEDAAIGVSTPVVGSQEGPSMTRTATFSECPVRTDR